MLQYLLVVKAIGWIGHSDRAILAESGARSIASSIKNEISIPVLVNGEKGAFQDAISHG